MPSNCLASDAAQIGSSSRKRTHAQITRSESRSLSPELPSKRRRTSPSASRNPSYELNPSQISHRRTPRDGFDYRRPIMATNNDINTQDTIDLTIDDETPPPASMMTTLAPRRPSSQSVRSLSPSAVDQRYLRAPPFGRDQRFQSEIIDLSDDERRSPDTQSQRTRSATAIDVSSSPEVEFVDERPVRPNTTDRNTSNTGRPDRTLPIPHGLDRRVLGTLPELLRRGSQFIFGLNNTGQGPSDFDEAALDRIDGLPNRVLVGGPHRTSGDAVLDIIDDYEVVNLDYRQPGFAMGNRHSETPQVIQEPYKGPSPAKEGFTRNFEEESVLVCPWCADELSTGHGDVKQQVWVVKQCGHVYCGACAASRVVARSSNQRGPRKGNGKTAMPFKNCIVNDCGKAVTAKTSMFPIYL